MKKYLYKLLYPFAQIYWFIFRPKTTGVRCLVENNEGDETLLVKHTYMYSDYWSAPGGGIKKGETVEDVATREVFEEVGVNIYGIKNVGKYETNAQYKKDSVSLCVAKTKDKNFKIDKREILEARWFSKSDLPENIFISTRKILEKI